MSAIYIAPEFRKTAFNCPHCHAYAQQEWKQLCCFTADLTAKANGIDYEFETIVLKPFYSYNKYELPSPDMKQILGSLRRLIQVNLYENFKPLNIYGCCCSCCNRYSYWYNCKMIYPPVCSAPQPNSDMPEDCQTRYLEAREIADKSPCAAAALLRLCLQMLMPHLGEKGKNINDDIASLVKQHKIPQEVQQALDICRVVGNNAVHPGEIDIDDNPQIVSSLFKLLNIIIEKTITAHKEISSLYAGLPPAAQQAIVKRDKS